MANTQIKHRVRCDDEFHGLPARYDVWRIVGNGLAGLLIFQDYRERWGTKCAGCGEYVEGDVVTAGDKHAFHPNCFHCQRCRQPLLGQGTKVSLVQGELPSRISETVVPRKECEVRVRCYSIGAIGVPVNLLKQITT